MLCIFDQASSESIAGDEGLLLFRALCVERVLPVTASRAVITTFWWLQHIVRCSFYSLMSARLEQ